jgi:hypothetical protein
MIEEIGHKQHLGRQEVRTSRIHRGQTKSLKGGEHCHLEQLRAFAWGIGWHSVPIIAHDDHRPLRIQFSRLIFQLSGVECCPSFQITRVFWNSKEGWTTRPAVGAEDAWGVSLE